MEANNGTGGDGVPYTGASADLDLGAYKITSTGIIDSSLTASQILGTNGSKQLVSLAVATYPSLAELAFVKGLTSALQTQLNGKLAIKTATWPFNGPTINSTTLNGETYYMVFEAEESAVVSGFILGVAGVGADPSNLRSALYDSGGNKLAAETTAVTVSAAQAIQIPWATTYTFVKGTTYVVGVEGDASNSTFYATSASINSTSHNRTGASTLGATVPTGTATAVRLCGAFY